MVILFYVYFNKRKIDYKYTEGFQVRLQGGCMYPIHGTYKTTRAGDWVSETLWVRIQHSAEEDNLSPFDSKISCLC